MPFLLEENHRMTVIIGMKATKDIPMHDRKSGL